MVQVAEPISVIVPPAIEKLPLIFKVLAPLFPFILNVPPAIVKMFMEQSFSKPQGPNVVVVPRKEIPNAAERAAFYRKYAEMAAN